ncbi:MAG: type I glutamate--ammonia ligase [Phycisphaeraceae bacterium]|nr:type I glutamate--ammonia ligase [Phycisphaeraceae bacterium]
MTPQDVLQLVQSNDIAYIDCCFQEFCGPWQHCTYAASELTEDSFTHGFGFDGSVIRGWQNLNESDLLLVPVAETAAIDPFRDRPTLQLICDIKDPLTKKRFSRDPRSIARKAEAYLKGTGIADSAVFSPEVEFFVFDNVSFDQRKEAAYYHVDSVEGKWQRGDKSPVNLGQQIRGYEGYFPMPPNDSLADLRSHMADLLEGMGVPVECHHHEVATGGQCEIDPRQQPLLAAADALQRVKYVVRNAANRFGKSATFMPKPIHEDNGSGMHIHFSLRQGEDSVFAGRKYAGLSQEGLWAIGGILKHAPSLLAFTNPSTNSYKRLVPGYEAPINLIYSSRNRSAAIRVPVYSNDKQTKRLEVRFPDPSANPYLAFAALVMAALDGIQNQIDPPEPVDNDIEQMSQQEAGQIERTPTGLSRTLDALQADHAYLLQGDVFTAELVRNWIDYKMESEVIPMASRPTPYEFCMYYNV